MKFYVFPLKGSDAFKGGYPFKGIRRNHAIRVYSGSGNFLKGLPLKDMRQEAPL